MKNLILFTLAISLFSCKKTELVDPDSPNYMSWSEGDWWAYEFAKYDYNNGDTTVFSVDTIFALADSMINGQLYRTLSGGLFPGQNNQMFMRDSSGYVVNISGTIIYSYENFTDTLSSGSDSNLGVSWYGKMVHDAEPTLVPAGSYTTINYQTVAVNNLMQYPCGLTQIVSDRQLAENVGMVRMSYHYSAPGPCIEHVKVLVDYYRQ